MSADEDEQESIYALVPGGSQTEPSNATRRPPRPSKYAADLAAASGRGRRAAATIGPPPGASKPDPRTGFLRKGAGVPRKSIGRPTASTNNSNARSSTTATTQSIPRSVKPPVPRVNESGVLAKPTSKNFVKDNKVEAIRDAPKKVTKEEFNYLKKKDYGKIPAYMEQVQNEITEEKEYIAALEIQKQTSTKSGPIIRELTMEEKNVQIAQLKARWEEVNTMYIRMPITVDTPSSRRRKEELENQLNALEKDIQALSKPHVYIQEEQES